MKVLNFGSLNLDYVYQVDHFVMPGETLSSGSREVKHGGKGLNQSIALARAGARTYHAGCMGKGGEELRDALAENGVDVSHLIPVDEMQGHTVIQVNPEGENCIILYGGSNQCVTKEQIGAALKDFGSGDWLVLQNEVNELPEMVNQAYEKGMRVALNPSPYDKKLEAVDFGKISWLLVNEVEAEQITSSGDPDEAWKTIHERWPGMSALITLGKKGSVAFALRDGAVERVSQEAMTVKAVDTTAAGDTYTGYFIGGMLEGRPLKECMERATKASAISVTRPGAADSIPWAREIE